MIRERKQRKNKKSNFKSFLIAKLNSSVICYIKIRVDKNLTSQGLEGYLLQKRKKSHEFRFRLCTVRNSFSCLNLSDKLHQPWQQILLTSQFLIPTKPFLNIPQKFSARRCLVQHFLMSVATRKQKL